MFSHDENLTHARRPEVVGIIEIQNEEEAHQRLRGSYPEMYGEIGSNAEKFATENRRI